LLLLLLLLEIVLDEERRVKLFDGSLDPPHIILQIRRSLNLAESIAEICSTITVKSDLLMQAGARFGDDNKLDITHLLDTFDAEMGGGPFPISCQRDWSDWSPTPP
jgi:hypothetical protein